MSIISSDAFILHQHIIPANLSQMIEIIPFGDLHRESEHCDVERWLDFCRKGRAETKQPKYYMGMGDYQDLASFSERLILENPALHDSTKNTFEREQRRCVESFAKEIAFMKGKLLGLIEGNHYWKFKSGITSTQYLCELMECAYLGTDAVVSIKLVFPGKGDHRTSLNIWAHHGMGAARTAGGSINRVEQMREIFPDMDYYLMGHDHKRGAWPVTVLDLSGKSKAEIAYKKQWLCRTGSFLRGYVVGEGSYVSRKLMNPADLGVIRLQITAKRPDDKVVLDTHVWA